MIILFIIRAKAASDSEDEIAEKVQKQKKKDAKKKEKKANSDDEEAADAPVSKVAKSFALLGVDSGPESAPSDNNDQSDSEPEVKVVKKNTMKKGNSDERTKEQGKKGKKGRRKKDDSDEDIDKVLAELEMEYSGMINDI